jgi:hypothetical protein
MQSPTFETVHAIIASVGDMVKSIQRSIQFLPATMTLTLAPTSTRRTKEKTKTQEVPQHRFRGFRSRGGLNYYIAIQLMKTEYQMLRGVRRLTDANASMQYTVVEAASFYGMTHRYLTP